jgi:hypothetical protein
LNNKIYNWLFRTNLSYNTSLLSRSKIIYFNTHSDYLPNPLFDSRVELVTAGLREGHANYLRHHILQDNALFVCNYILAMKTRPISESGKNTKRKTRQVHYGLIDPQTTPDEHVPLD